MGQGVRAGLEFFKGHGLGNDYLVFEGREVGARGGAEDGPPTGRREGTGDGGGARAGSSDEARIGSGGAPPGGEWPLLPDAVRRVCHRWRGVGSDGIVVRVGVEEGRHLLRMFNPDGSPFERSGNGLRVFAAFLGSRDEVGKERFEVVSGGDVIGMQVLDVPRQGTYDVAVEMGRASLGSAAVGLDPDELLEPGLLPGPGGGPKGAIEFHPVSVGNPHAVVFTDDLSAERLSRIGPYIATHPAFRHGTNVQLAKREGPGRIRIGIWERGVGRTSASGTSSCAAAVAAVSQGLVEPGEVRVEMEGGALYVTVGRELEVTLRGLVEGVFTGRLSNGFARALDVAG